MEMEDQVPEFSTVEEFERKRECLYCVLSILTCSLIPVYYYILEFDFVEYVIQSEKLPVDLLVYIGLIELVKVGLVLGLFPISAIRKKRSNWSSRSGSLEDEDVNEEYDEIPKIGGMTIRERDCGKSSTVFGRHDYDLDDEEADAFTDSKNKAGNDTRFSSKYQFGLLFKVWEFIKGILCFILAVGICHVFTVLFGAPILTDSQLTLQFSFLVVIWLFLPLCINVRPSTILHEFIFMKLWNTDVEWVRRAKRRFMVTLFGAWCGAIAFPLDWDRPWQKWPIPCVVSTSISYFLFHCFTLVYDLSLLYGTRLKRLLGFHSLNKLKVY